MSLQITIKLIPITEDMSILEKINADAANNTVLYLSDFLKTIPFDKKTEFTLTADIKKVVIVERR